MSSRPRNTVVIGIALVALIVGSSVPAAASRLPTGTSTSSNYAETSDLADAVRFRDLFGLVDAQADVAAIFGREPVSESWGTPLTRAEEALMNRRAEVPAELSSLRAYRSKHRDNWGGMWLTYPKNASLERVATVNVGILDGAADVEATLEPLAPSDVELVMHTVRYSQSELDGLHEELAGSKLFAATGSTFYAASTMQEQNLVEIVVDKVTPGLEDALSRAYGDRVTVVEGEPTMPDACSRVNCGPPWRGGIKIARSSTALCTAGFGVQYYAGVWNYAMFTAGHCGSATWKEGTSSGTTIGTTSQNHFHAANPIDVQVIPINSSWRSNEYLDGTSGCSSCVLRSITADQAKDADDPGDAVCNHGAFSGTRCGAISSVNYTFTWVAEGETLLHTRRATYLRMGGDSGGPVTSTASMAVGSHTHYVTISGTQYAVYTHVWEMENVTGWGVSHS